MHLTEEQRQAVASKPTPIRMLDDTTGEVYLLISERQFPQLARLLNSGEADDSTSAEIGKLIAETMHEEDEGDPLLESYQQYREVR